MSTTGAAGGGPVTAAGDGAVTPVAERPVTTGRLRRVFLGPQGGGTLRRRASDAFRLGFAILLVAASIPVMRANSDAEIAIVHGVTVTAVVRAPHQVWGLEQFTGQDGSGGTVEMSVYGRDAADARMLAKIWRFCFYRD